MREKKNFSVVCLVTWPMNGSEVGGNLVLIMRKAGRSVSPQASLAQ